MVGKHEYMNMGPRIYRVCYATVQKVKSYIDIAVLDIV